MILGEANGKFMRVLTATFLVNASAHGHILGKCKFSRPYFWRQRELFYFSGAVSTDNFIKTFCEQQA